MRIAKRILLFLAVNFLVVITVSILLSIFNVRPYLTEYGIDYAHLLIFCFVWGMGGAFISLALSRKMAKWMMGVKVIDPKTLEPSQKALIAEVAALTKKAKIPMPEVGIFKSPEVNAFATGPTKKRSLVAVSSGLLEKMDNDQVAGVLAHEITHIANGDMVTMTLLQGVVNAFVMFLARVLAFVLSGLGRGDRRGSYGSYFLFTMLFQIVFMILGSMIVLWFSRWREFRADAGGAKLAGREKMISALQGLKSHVNKRYKVTEKAALQTMKISTQTKTGLARLFSSHPPLEERIERLKTWA
ncbi:MAG: Protease HtpX [Chlamydiae bacterium]|nr:Protease HtpX [Chlamydiota bacterium]